MNQVDLQEVEAEVEVRDQMTNIVRIVGPKNIIRTDNQDNNRWPAANKIRAYGNWNIRNTLIRLVRVNKSV